jgi:uncharacterized delta-60 repeat protein
MNATYRLIARLGMAAGVLGGLLIACTPPTAQSLTAATDPATTDPSTTDPGTTDPSTTDPGTTTTSTPPLVRGEPIREWSFTELRGDALEKVEVDADIQVGGVLHELFDFGPTFRDTDVFDPDGTSLPSDGIATGQIASTADGGTFWVGAEAPRGNATANDPQEPIGGQADLKQTQSFIKRTEDATLSITLSAAFIETTDLNDVLLRTCPEIHEDGLRCDLIKGQVFFDVEAFTVPPAPDIIPFETFFHVAGGATVTGFAENWDSEAWSTRFSQVPLWDIEDFDFVIEDLDGHREGLVLMILREPRTFDVDLSSVDVGEAFTLQSFVDATTYNRIAGPPSEFGSSVSAFLRDPLSSNGSSLTFSGIEPTDVPDVERPAEEPVEPAPCQTEPDPDPAAGVLQFSAGSYAISEASPTPIVIVTRTGGTAGAVTATFSTSDGSAVAGTDYTPVNASVFFGDGDDVPRRVEVPIVQDVVGGEPDATVNLTLSEPGGCAALGTPTEAVLTIRDDDPAPPPVADFGLDPTFGDGGKATTTAFGGDRSAMAVTPDGKIVMAGGTFTDFVLARFNADGTPDESFDTDGLVTTDIGGGFAQEEALGVAVQPDGRIVVAGYTGGDDVALARYDDDGSLDETFGTGGIVTGVVEGIANDVTIQPDGAIVVAGTRSRNDPTGQDFGDLLVARFLDDGRPDPSFDVDGQLTTDVGQVTNEGQNVVVQPDGAIVVSGSSRNPGSNGVGIDHHTDVVRYLSDGQPDGSFGTDGQVTLEDTLAGNDLALQPDGRLVLVGTEDATVPPSLPGTTEELLVVRLETDGDPDPGFGTDGFADLGISGQRDTANAVALQADGRIVVGGKAKSLNPDMAVARFTADGIPDESFGDGGAFTIDFFGFSDIGENVAVQDDGKILVSGLARNNVDGYGIARLGPLPTDAAG